MKAPSRVAIVCLRRIGDVLLTTVLASSIRRAWPQAELHWFVFEGTGGPLRNNPACDRIYSVSQGQGLGGFLRQWGLTHFRFYDVALAAQSGDRPALMARWLGRRAYCLSSDALGGGLRDSLMTETVKVYPTAHRVSQALRLCEPLGITPIAQVSSPNPRHKAELVLPSRYWVFHPGAAFVYKRWNKAGWRALSQHVLSLGVSVLVTGGSDARETEYLDDLFEGLSVCRLDGRLDWSELVSVLQGAERYVGVDTSVTHLAAALGVTCSPIFGPTNPSLWAPLSPERSQVFNQSKLPTIPVIHHLSKVCWPCQLEGCERHINSHSDCLDDLTLDSVLDQMKKTET